MKSIRLAVACVMIGSAALLTGCGGGSVDVSVGATVGPVYTPAFDIGALVNGQPVPGFDVQPGDTQTVNLYVGDSFELDSNAGVFWTVYVNGVAVPTVNNAVVVGNATITESVVSNSQFSGYVTSQGTLSAPVQLTLIATSVLDGSQTAQINFVISN